jgi:hypothetical protein
MGSRVRFSLLALIVSAFVAVLAPVAAQAASFGVASFFASNCNAASEGCKKATNASEEKELAEEEGYTQAAGHPPFGITDFTVNTEAVTPGPLKPVGVVTHIRTDVAPGVSTNPQAREKCSLEDFGTTEVAPGLYGPPSCGAGSIIGTNKVVVYIEGVGDIPLEGTVYNLQQPKGDASDFGVALNATNLGAGGLFAHTLIEGHVEWGAEAKGTGKADYHDFFEIDVSPALPLISSRLIFDGNTGETGEGGGAFLTLPSTCSGVGPQTTSTLHLTSSTEASAVSTYTTPIGTEGCDNAVPFAPTFKLTPETTKSDSGDGLTADLGLPHDPSPTALDSSQLKSLTVTLPEGLTLNPSAAAELGACTPKEIGIGTTRKVECPADSKIGTADLEVPGLPPGSLTGSVYLGGPEGGGAITAPPYAIYVDAESEQYGVAVRLKGSVTPNEATGQLTATFSENPEQPFTSLSLHFKGGEYAPVANPLSCGTATATTSIAPFTVPTALKSPSSSFAVDSNGEKGACASPLAFTPTQGTENQYGSAGAHTVFKFSLTRSEGQQYLSRVSTTLPAGLVGAIPTVPLCAAPSTGATGTCPETSKIGTATVTAGSGKPLALSGTVYLTGPYEGAPYGLLVSVPVVAGPFNLGVATTRATINVNQSTGQVIIGSNLPTIVAGGVPVRLRSLSVEINRSGFLSNPTNCGVLATESTVTGLGSQGTSVKLSTPFQVANCGALAFKPTFAARTSGMPTKAGGASLETTINQPAGEANIKSVVVQLPKQMPSRNSTLQKACAAATFEANPTNCDKESIVGSARANTPVLPSKLQGLAYLVGHAGAAFPDLDLVLEADGVRVILVGNTNIKNGITTTTFASTPDVPVSSITVNLPMGPHSALSPYGSFCAQPLVMPTTITAQNGLTFKQNTIIKPIGCGVKITGHKVVGNTAYITVQTPAAGRVSGGGSSLATVYRHLAKAEKTATIKVPLSKRGSARRRPFAIKLRVGFLPKTRTTTPISAAFVTVTFR